MLCPNCRSETTTSYEFVGDDVVVVRWCLTCKEVVREATTEPRRVLWPARYNTDEDNGD